MIRLLEYYSGRLTNERLIAPGDYEDDDPALFGLRDRLLEMRAAVVLTVDAPAPPLPIETPVTLQGISQDELVEKRKPKSRR
jgi:hypothetical protein